MEISSNVLLLLLLLAVVVGEFEFCEGLLYGIGYFTNNNHITFTSTDLQLQTVVTTETLNLRKKRLKIETI